MLYKLASAKYEAAQWKDCANRKTLAHLKRELQLSPEQAAEIETALDDFSLYYQMPHSRMGEVMAPGKSRIDQMLNEERRKKFSRIMKELKRRVN
ncbi:MAG: hypothetical protein ACKV2U_26315 [Bryobacteraceae bacterium]